MKAWMCKSVKYKKCQTSTILFAILSWSPEATPDGLDAREGDCSQLVTGDPLPKSPARALFVLGVSPETPLPLAGAMPA